MKKDLMSVRAFSFALVVVLSSPLVLHAQRRGAREPAPETPPPTAPPDSTPSARRIELDLGEQETIPASNVRSYSEGAAGIVDVRISDTGDQFVVVALRAGITSLLLIYNDGHQIRYTIQVNDPRGNAAPTGGVPPRENIRLDLYFVQLSEQNSHQIGLGWPGSVSGQLATSLTFDFTRASSLAGATASIASNFLPRVDLAQNAGWARLMRQATIITANNTQAQLSSGGSVNIVTQTALATQVARIRFGSDITITPRYDPTSGRIELQIQASVSDLTPGAGAAPGLTETSVTSVANLELGQAMVLGGLVSESTTESQGGIPGLSQIPILGVLFGSNGRSSNQLENLIFIIPTVIEPLTRENRDLVAETLRDYRQFGNIGGRGLNNINLIEGTPAARSGASGNTRTPARSERTVQDQ